MNKTIEKVRNYPFSCLVSAIIWIICLIPIPETLLDEVSFIDKWTHFVMYAFLTMTIWGEYAWKNKKSRSFQWKNLLVGGVVCPIIMGGLVELAQAYLTTCRSGDWMDAVCNALGVVIGVVICIPLANCRAIKDRD